jgi:hypothetical protein
MRRAAVGLGSVVLNVRDRRWGSVKEASKMKVDPDMCMKTQRRLTEYTPFGPHYNKKMNGLRHKSGPMARSQKPWRGRR